MDLAIPTDIAYVFLLVVLFVVPRYLQRYRLPSAITSLMLGAGGAALGLFQHDETVALLASFGIVALFLFAGLELQLDELRPEFPVLVQHLVIWALLLGAVTWGVHWFLDLPFRAACLYGLALVTPSTGFILDSLNLFGFSEAEQRWTKQKAIAAELLALGVLFVALQSSSLRQLVVSTAALALLLLLIPALFRFFAARIAPYAPRSEFAFLLMVAVVSAYTTRRLGVYYLVGAFVVGLAAQRFRERLPAMSSERMLSATQAFASFFIPFYFFKAGLGITTAVLTGEALLTGLVLLAVLGAVRVAVVLVHRHLALHESYQSGSRVAVALLPTLVFALVIAEILRDEFGLDPVRFGALIAYTVATTALPGLLFRTPPPEFDAPPLPPLEPGRREASSEPESRPGVPAPAESRAGLDRGPPIS
jgi:Kef-type K+ transport system membrane component KefB